MHPHPRSPVLGGLGLNNGVDSPPGPAIVITVAAVHCTSSGVLGRRGEWEGRGCSSVGGRKQDMALPCFPERPLIPRGL